MVLKLFFFFRTLFFSSATFILLILASAFLKLGVFLKPLLGLAGLVYIVLLMRAIKEKDRNKLLGILLIGLLAFLFALHFDYTKCIATGYCWR